MLDALQLDTEAAVPLKVTVPLPWDEPKFAPAIITKEPTVPEVGDRVAIEGVGRTVKPTPLLA